MESTQSSLVPSDEAKEKYFTQAALDYQPTNQDIFITTSKGETQRLIFAKPQQLKENEEKELQGLRDYIRSRGNQMPPGFDDDQRLILRFLQGMKFHYEHTEKAMNENAIWRRESFPMDTRPFMDYLNQGIIYAYQRDKGQRPIIIINVEKISSSKIEQQNLINLSDYFLDHILTNIMYPSRIENWNVIVDLNNVGLTQIPQKLLKNMIAAMQRNYRGRMFKLYAINTHWLVRGLFKIAKSMLDEFTLSKINVLSTDFQASLLQTIDKSCLEQQYGGTLPNKTANYFPPEMLPQ
eukprot:403366847